MREKVIKKMIWSLRFKTYLDANGKGEMILLHKKRPYLLRVNERDEPMISSYEIKTTEK